MKDTYKTALVEIGVRFREAGLLGEGTGYGGRELYLRRGDYYVRILLCGDPRYRQESVQDDRGNVYTSTRLMVQLSGHLPYTCGAEAIAGFAAFLGDVAVVARGVEADYREVWCLTQRASQRRRAEAKEALRQHQQITTGLILRHTKGLRVGGSVTVGEAPLAEGRYPILHRARSYLLEVGSDSTVITRTG